MRRLLAGTAASSAPCGDDWILCAIGSGIALLALGAGEISLGTPGCDLRSVFAIGTAGASDDAGAAGGRSFAEGIAVGGDRFSAVHRPLDAAGSSPDDDAADGSVGGVTGAGSSARAVAAAAIGGGVAVRTGGGRGGVGWTFAIAGGVGTRGTFADSGTLAIAGGVGTRGAVIDFGRGAFAGVGTIGRGFAAPGSDGGR